MPIGSRHSPSEVRFGTARAAGTARPGAQPVRGTARPRHSPSEVRFGTARPGHGPSEVRFRYGPSGGTARPRFVSGARPGHSPSEVCFRHGPARPVRGTARPGTARPRFVSGPARPGPARPVRRSFPAPPVRARPVPGSFSSRQCRVFPAGPPRQGPSYVCSAAFVSARGRLCQDPSKFRQGPFPRQAPPRFVSAVRCPRLDISRQGPSRPFPGLFPLR